MSESIDLVDSLGRHIRDLRISITDRCNFRCLYCLPETEEAADFYLRKSKSSEAPQPIRHAWKPRSHFLTYEEITRLARIATGLGVTKIRLTGGEPLLRRAVPELVRQLSALEGVDDLALTTNGFHFDKHADDLRAAGLSRVTFSLDSLDRENFKKLTGRDGLAELLAAISRARELGFAPVKINAVIIRDLNDHEIEALAQFARDEALVMRFIEFMPLDSGRAWQREHVVTGREILERIQAAFGLEPVGMEHAAATATRWRFKDGEGEIGLISPVSEPFCGQCNRLRLTADGKIRTCLFSLHEHDLKPLLRGNATDSEIAEWLQAVVLKKEPRHHIGETDFEQPDRTMSAIGG
ncbi:MAG: GTP 3',8-cyclase MoaA [Verrucomicrobia subdivision 3 bacterium]|nr:GTP 3',8-cyclase MoaA [Limisphaerales bacterium]